ncbi:MAG: tetratricopeptide repeat protein [Bacteroidales bacterium]|nr:tetratricopeptide repeat protein [Bacteroidales bacterium]
MKSRYIHSLLLSTALLPALSAGAVITDADPAVAILSGPYPEASATLGSRFEQARRLDSEKNYRGVIDQLRSVAIASETPLSPEADREFLYLLGKAFYETGDSRALRLLDDYIALWPAGEDALHARLLQADFYFFAHDWSGALERYRALDPDVLDSAQRDLYTYREALCLIKCGFYEETRPLLTRLRNSKDYALSAKYYDAYIYYVEGNDAKAMSLFREVADSGVSNPELCPDYYIAQLLFRQGNWRETSSLASSLLRRNLNPELASSTRRIYGMSEYELGDYTKATPLLEKYVAETDDSASHDALYALGVCLYSEDNLTQAERYLTRVAADHDAIGQGAALYLGQIAARRGEVSVAAMNFERAYRMNYDNRVAEAALYNYVTARARGGNIPFDSNVELLEEFIKNYPNSEYAPVIERHLSTLYYNNGDYENALRVAERIRRPSKSDTALLQMILYSGGTSALSAGKSGEAARLLEKCVAIKDADADVRTQARVWLGDALYDLGMYRDAEMQYNEAVRSGRAGDNTLHARYNLGYSRMMQNRFADASSTFSQLLSSSLDIPEEMRRDARLRLADCKYYAGRYGEAKSDFAALRSGGHGADYATYRHAQILGIEGDINGKIAELRNFERDFSDSRWMPNALNELADTYVAAGNPKDAAAAYSRMLRKYPVDASAPRAQLGMASALMDAGDASEGAEAYKEILRRWPASTEAAMADAALRDYYAETGGLSDYARFLQSIPGFSINAAEMETLAYDAAERQFLNNTDTPAPLKRYLEEYPEGTHAAEAWSLLARHYSDSNDRANALAAYRELEKRGGAEYAVEAYIGIMRTADNVGVRGDYAHRLLSDGGVPADAMEEARFYLTEAQLQSKNPTERSQAEKTLRELADNPFSEFGARSAVTLGEYLLSQKRPQEALTLMEDFTSSGSQQQYWVARGFIILADAYTDLGDSYMAKEYLRSLKRNYPGDEPDISRAIDQRLK